MSRIILCEANIPEHSARCVLCISSSIGVTKYEAHTLRFSLMSGSTVRLLLVWPLEGIGVVKASLVSVASDYLKYPSLVGTPTVGISFHVLRTPYFKCDTD